MRFFLHKYGATLQTPDKLDDIIDGELEEGIIWEVSWSKYLSYVKRNQELRDMKFGRVLNPDRWEVFIHAKYYPKEYQMEDRISEKHNKKYAATV